MLIRFYRSGFPIQYASIILAALLLWGRAFFDPPSMPAPEGPGPLYPLLYAAFSNIPYLATMLSFVMLLAAAFWFNRLLDKHELIPKNSSISALIFTVLVSLSPPQLTLTPGNISLFFLILALQNMMASYDRLENLDLIYAASFFISTGALFYPPFLIFYGYLLIGFIVFRAGNWREWVASFFGLCTPFLYLLLHYFWFDTVADGLLAWTNFFSLPFVYPPDIHQGFWLISGSTILLVFWGLVRIFGRPMEKTASLRAKTYYFFWMIPFTFLSYIYASSLTEYHLVLFAPAFSLVISGAAAGARKTFWPDLILTVYLLLILLNNTLLFYLL